ncbi:MAG: antitoxin YezG family protein [Eubacteriaceae bacterium]|nr:antitoxin YezG family protein [Eubacteriaceae bacterium]
MGTRRIVAVFLAIAIIAGCAACNKKKSANSQTATENKQETIIEDIQEQSVPGYSKDMQEELDACCNEFGTLLNEAIPTEWDVAYLLGEVEESRESYLSVFYFVESETNNTIRMDEIPKRYGIKESVVEGCNELLSQQVLRLNNCFNANGYAHWDQMTYILENNGDFEIRYKYHAMQEEIVAGKREAIWAFETFRR